MKRDAWIIVASALLILVIGTFVLWKTVGNPCTSPVVISQLNEPLDSYSPDKSGAKRVKIGMEGNLSTFQYILDAGKKTRTTYDPNETLMIVILEGSGILQSAHFTDKQELIWFQEAAIKFDDFLTVPANIAFQLEASTESPLRYLVFSTKGSQAKDRIFLREEHPSTFPCRKEIQVIKKVPELNAEPEGSSDDVNRPVI